MRGILRSGSEDMTGKKYRLPSEAEWEYAARSGGKEEIWAGTSKTKDWDTKLANGLKLHDMSGNVWEWIEDIAGIVTITLAPTDGRAWQSENSVVCGRRVGRGGSWDNVPESLRSSNRDTSQRRQQEQQRWVSSCPGLKLILFFVLLPFAAAKPPAIF